MPRSRPEVADIFRAHGAAWRTANAGHISLDQLKVMSAIERCRTATLGGHVARCEDCAHEHIAYNSCRNRHCPKCQAGAAKAWLAAREAELLPVRYFHLVFTLPKPIADLAHQNKRQIYNLLMRASADTVIRIAADPKHLGARIGITSVLHTWGSAMTHHPHVHMIVPGGGLSADGTKWIACRRNFFLSVRVLSRLYRRLILEGLVRLHKSGKLQFFGDHAELVDRAAFDAFLQPLRKIDWVVYAKEPFAGPKAVLAYGLMTLLVWVGARVWTTLPPRLYFGALFVSAFLFGAGHLPAMAALIPLTPVVILRTVGLNALLGLAFGWLFWRRGLEHAMVAHVATHLAFWSVAVAL